MELSSTAENAKNQNNNSCGEMEYENIKVKGTPLIKRWEADNGWSFGIGGYRLSEWMESEKEVDKRIQEMNWNDIAGMIGAMIDATLKMNNLIK